MNKILYSKPLLLFAESTSGNSDNIHTSWEGTGGTESFNEEQTWDEWWASNSFLVSLWNPDFNPGDETTWPAGFDMGDPQTWELLFN